jgi:hypothetical protein
MYQSSETTDVKMGYEWPAQGCLCCNDTEYYLNKTRSGGGKKDRKPDAYCGDCDTGHYRYYKRSRGRWLRCWTTSQKIAVKFPHKNPA